MKKVIFSSIGTASLLAFVGLFFFLPTENSAAPIKTPDSQALVFKMRLIQKDSHFNEVKGGIFGNLGYTENYFNFTGMGLQKNASYALINQMAGFKIKCLGQEKTDKSGNLQIEGNLNQMVHDTVNLPPNGGYKIRLVLAEDADCSKGELAKWNYKNWLFEENGLVFPKKFTELKQ